MPQINLSKDMPIEKAILKFRYKVKKESGGTNTKYFSHGSGLKTYGHGWSKRASRGGGRQKGRRKRNRYKKRAIKKRADKQKASQNKKGGQIKEASYVF